MEKVITSIIITIQFFIVFNNYSIGQEIQSYKRVIKLMGSRFEITAISENRDLAEKSVDAAINEIDRIEKQISSWDPNSQTSEVNRNAGIKPVKVDAELFYLIKRSKKISVLTGGVFDISYASLDKIWKFDGTMERIPTKVEMEKSVQKINYENIILDEENSTVFLKRKGMKIGFGGIGKGYAANKAKDLMITMGISSGVVNASGDLTTWGKKENGEEWGVGITDPTDKTKTFSWLIIGEKAVATSGNYEKFVEFDGIRYTHIINPKTGLPAFGIKSVTIICPDAELADALATAVFILGEEDGIALIDRLKGIECLLFNENDELKTSRNMNLNYYLSDTKSK
jgi:thiamine biosynthesis lipoprotein